MEEPSLESLPHRPGPAVQRRVDIRVSAAPLFSFAHRLHSNLKPDRLLERIPQAVGDLQKKDPNRW
jgi:hypothetical protein